MNAIHFSSGGLIAEQMAHAEFVENRKLPYICVMKNKVIDITTSTGRDLKSRIAVREFRDLILSHNADLIIIDFKNVNFATRSFIDEFYNVIINNSEIHTELLNISSEIQAMFDAVKSTQHVAKSFPLNRKSSKVVKFSSVSEVNNYLSSLSFL